MGLNSRNAIEVVSPSAASQKSVIPSSAQINKEGDEEIDIGGIEEAQELLDDSDYDYPEFDIITREPNVDYQMNLKTLWLESYEKFKGSHIHEYEKAVKEKNRV